MKKREDHTKKAYRGIRQMLFHNEIVPGQKISYRDLAERLGMSPTPVIQALKWLELKGLVYHEPNRGYYTEPVSLKEVQEIYEFRALIEVSLLPEVIRLLDEKGCQHLRTALDNHLNAARDIFLKDRLVKDMEFHLTLASLSQRHIQQQVLQNLFDILYLKYRTNILFMTPVDTAGIEHQELFEHVVNGNLKNAQKILADHIGHVKEHVIDGLRRLQKEKKESTF
ncbi:MAG: GntR family transcriptional regulator [Pseudomonadota bacterium]|nr:GntR family transcriptional regulator [Pseudomonadota bacterium]